LSIAAVFGFCSLLFAILSEAWLLGFGFFASSIVSPAVLTAMLIQRTKLRSGSNCTTVFRALAYLGSAGNIHSFDFRCRDYLRAFVRANRLKLVNASAMVSQIARDLPISENQVARRLTKRLR
jgi:hypothetical protein